MPVFMNLEHDLVVSGYCGGSVDVVALFLGTFFGGLQKAEARKQPQHLAAI